MNRSLPSPTERVVLNPAERSAAVVDVINSARERLSLSLFRCDDHAVLDALGAAVERGVRVEALLTSRAKGSKAQLRHLEAFLRTRGADVRRYSDTVVRYHAKYIVADSGPALVASLNFTKKCFTETCDFLLVTTDPVVVSGLRTVFDTDRNGARSAAAADVGDRLIVGPEEARRRFTALFESASHRIRIIDPKIDDPAMLTLLKARAAAGVTVEIRAAQGLGALRPHGKLLIIDDATAVIGSISLSTLALEFRRELAVVTRDSGCLAALNQFWGSLPEVVNGGLGAAASAAPLPWR